MKEVGGRGNIVIIIIVFISNMNMIIINISLETQEISGFSENMTAEMDSGIHKVFSFSGVEENQVKNNSIHLSVLLYSGTQQKLWNRNTEFKKSYFYLVSFNN